MDYLEQLLGTTLNTGVRAVIAFAVVLTLILFLAWIFRRLAGGRLPNEKRGRVARLAILEAIAVDPKRRLVLLRRDNTEHLVLIGGNNDVVIEQGILRMQRPVQANRTHERVEPILRPPVPVREPLAAAETPTPPLSAPPLSAAPVAAPPGAASPVASAPTRAPTTARPPSSVTAAPPPAAPQARTSPQPLPPVPPLPTRPAATMPPAPPHPQPAYQPTPKPVAQPAPPAPVAAPAPRESTPASTGHSTQPTPPSPPAAPAPRATAASALPAAAINPPAPAFAAPIVPDATARDDTERQLAEMAERLEAALKGPLPLDLSAALPVRDEDGDGDANERNEAPAERRSE